MQEKKTERNMSMRRKKKRPKQKKKTQRRKVRGERKQKEKQRAEKKNPRPAIKLTRAYEVATTLASSVGFSTRENQTLPSQNAGKWAMYTEM